MRVLSLSLCLGVYAECSGDCAPAQSAALLQSATQRKKPQPRLLSPAHFGHFRGGAHGPQGPLGPHGPYGRPYQALGHGPFGPPRNRSMVKVNQSPSQGGYSESSYGGPVITPCSEPSEFHPDIEMWGWCDTYSMSTPPDEAQCEAAGCRFSWGSCLCEHKDGCLALGAVWHGHTCQDELQNLMHYEDALLESQRTGTCEGQGNGHLSGMVAYPASQCCSDYPNTLCERNVRKMTPCVSSCDFMPDAYSWVYCDLWESPPTAEQCNAEPECKVDQWGSCNCKTEASCSALGGHFHAGKCEKDLSWWFPEVHKGVAKAKELGTCEGAMDGHGELKWSVDWLGHSCCASSKSICEELDHYVSEYANYY